MRSRAGVVVLGGERRQGALRWFGLCLVAAVVTAAAGCAGSEPEKVVASGVVGTWGGPLVENGPVPQATAVILEGGAPAVVEAVGSRVQILRPRGDALQVRSSVELGAPVVWMQPRVDGGRVVVLAQTCPTPLSTVDSTDSRCPGRTVSLVTFTGRDLVAQTEAVPADEVPVDLAVLRDAMVITTPEGVLVRSGTGPWKPTTRRSRTCVTDEAQVDWPLSPPGAPTTTFVPGAAQASDPLVVRPLLGGTETTVAAPGKVLAVTCAPGGYVASVYATADISAGASFWGSKGLGPLEDLGGPSRSQATIQGQLSRGQWAKATMGGRRTVFIDPTNGDWFAATGMKGAETPAYATRSGEQGLVFTPDRGGGQWTLRTYNLKKATQRS